MHGGGATLRSTALSLKPLPLIHALICCVLAQGLAEDALPWRHGTPREAPIFALDVQALPAFKFFKTASVSTQSGDDIVAAGVWHGLPSGRLWHVKLVAAPGALTLSVAFDALHLPPGSSLRVYVPAAAAQHGYATCTPGGCEQLTAELAAALGGSDPGSSGASWSPRPLPGGDVVVEFFLPGGLQPTSSDPLLPFEIAVVVQGLAAPLPRILPGLQDGVRLWLTGDQGRRRLSESRNSSQQANQQGDEVGDTSGNSSSSELPAAVLQQLRMIAGGSWQAASGYLGWAGGRDGDGGDDGDSSTGSFDESAYYDVLYEEGGSFPGDAERYSYDDLEAAVLGQAGGSARCSQDAACDADLADLRRAAVMLVVFTSTYQGLCSGNLINSHSGRQLLLTAYHCLNGGTDRRVLDTAWTRSWVAVFNHGGGGCGDTSSGRDGSSGDGGEGEGGGNSTPQRVRLLVGLEYVWGDVAADQLLLEVIDDIPDDYDPHFLGWDSTPGTSPKAALCVHHPRGDVAKALYSSVPPEEVRVIPTGGGAIGYRRGGEHRRSHWELHWSSGATSEGSSGAMLIDRGSGLLVATLTGGMSDCTNGKPDAFTKLSEAWSKHGLWAALGGAGPKEGAKMPPRGRGGPLAPRLAMLADPEQLLLQEGGGLVNVGVRLQGTFLDGEAVMVLAGVAAPLAASGVPVVVRPPVATLTAGQPAASFSLQTADGARGGSARAAFELVLTASSDADPSFRRARAIPFSVLLGGEKPLAGDTFRSAFAVPGLPFHHHLPSLEAFGARPDSTALRGRGASLFGADLYYSYQGGSPPSSSQRMAASGSNGAGHNTTQGAARGADSPAASKTTTVADVSACLLHGEGVYLVVLQEGAVAWAAERSGPGCAELRGVQLAGGLQYTFVATALRSQPGAAQPEGFSMHVVPVDEADALPAGSGSGSDSSSSSSSGSSLDSDNTEPRPAAGTRSTRTLLGALQQGVPWLRARWGR